MKIIIRNAVASLFIVSILFSCGRIKTSNTVGDWYYTTGRNMGGYNITAQTKLTIIRIVQIPAILTTHIQFKLTM